MSRLMKPITYITNLIVGCMVLLVLYSCDSAKGRQAHAKMLRPDIRFAEVQETDSAIQVNEQGMVMKNDIPYSGYLVAQDSHGNIKYRKRYVEGLLDGAWVSYFPDGKVKTKRMYSEGEKHGQHLGYYANGQLRFSYYFERGLSQGNHKSWYASGQLSAEMNYKDGYELGAQKVWRPDGKLRSNYVVRENGRRYGMIGLKRCSKIDSESGDIDRYK